MYILLLFPYNTGITMDDQGNPSMIHDAVKEYLTPSACLSLKESDILLYHG